MATGFGTWANTVEAHAVLKQIAQNEVNRLRPASRLAEVTSIDSSDKSLLVKFVGESNEVKVPYTSVAPANTGQWVRIGGTTHDRYVEDVIGTTDVESRLTETESHVNSLMSSILGDEWSGDDDGEDNTFLGRIGEFFDGLGGDSEDVKDLIENLTGQARATLTDALNDAATFAAQLQTLLSGGTVASPLPNLTFLVQLSQSQITGLSTRLTELDDNDTGLDDALGNLAGNINSAISGGIASGTGAIEQAWDTISTIFGIAMTAKNQIQTFDNETNNTGSYDGVSYQIVFGGSNGSALPSVDWPSGSSEIVIRGSNGYAGISSGAGDNVYHKIFAHQFTLDSQAAGIILGDSANSDQRTGILLRSNSDFTVGVYCGVSTSGIVIGKYTRSGSTWTRTQFASQSLTLRTGDIVYFKCYQQNYYVYVNGVLKLSYTETANTVSVGTSYRYTGFSEQRSSVFISYDSFRVVAFAMSDWIPSGAAVSTPSWRISRSSTSYATVSNLSRGDTAVVPSGFFSSQEYLADATVDNLGLGRVAIVTAGFYEISGSMIVAHSSGNVPEGPQFFSVYVNGYRAVTAVPIDTSTILYLAAGDIVQPGYIYLANNTSYSNSTYDYINRIKGGPSAYFQGRLISKG